MTQWRLHINSLSPPVQENDTQTRTPYISPFSCTAFGSYCAESCCSRWSPLFGSGPDHVTTKWWKLRGACVLSISSERLGAGNRQGTWRYIHALRHRRTHVPEPQQWWVDGFYSVKMRKRERGICCVFFLPHCRQTGRGRKGGAAVISTVVLCCESGSEAAASSMEDAHNRWCWLCYSAT